MAALEHKPLQRVDIHEHVLMIRLTERQALLYQ